MNEHSPATEHERADEAKPHLSLSESSVAALHAHAFIVATRREGGPAATLSDAVLERQYHDDDKGAFIAWFEGRPTYKPEDWALLLLAARHCLPPFSEGAL